MVTPLNRQATIQRFNDSAVQGLRSEEHTSELQSQSNLVCRLLLEKKKKDVCHPVLHTLPDDNSSHPYAAKALPVRGLFVTSSTTVHLVRSTPAAHHDQTDLSCSSL